MAGNLVNTLNPPGDSRASRKLISCSRLPLPLLSPVLFIHLLVLSFAPLSVAQHETLPLPSIEETTPDTLFTPVGQDRSVNKRLMSLNQQHRSRPMHPYFRDGYRVIRDMRRLVLMFNRGAVNGYESLNDLVNAYQGLPESKQTEMLYTAQAGGVVNFLSGEMNKQLRKNKISFLQWRMEKVYFRNRFKYFTANIYAGYNTKGYGIYFPLLRLHYYRQVASYYSSEGFTFVPMKKLGINFTRWNGTPILTPYFLTRYGTIALSYDKTRKIVRSRIDLRKSSSFVLRVVHINFLDHNRPDRLLSEFIIFW